MNKAFSALMAVSLVSVASAQSLDAPAEMLQDGSLRIRATGLSPAASYSVQAEWVSRSGTIWRSAASFAASEQGVIDLSTATPLSGSYAEADPLGLVWSMANTKERDTDASRFESDDRSSLSIAVLDGGKTVVGKRVTLWKRAPGVSTTDVREPFVGTLCAPYGGRKLPAVLVLGGSEGGVPRDLAALFASHGYVALGVAYFGAGSLPAELDRVPVETVSKALRWLAAQPMVDAKRIAVFGGSKGAELALLAASQFPAIKAVVASAPSSVVYQSIREVRAATSSWTLGAKDIPFAPYVASPAFQQSHKLVDLYSASLAAAPPESEIEIEKINGPVLLISGKQDALWPSAEMADRLVARHERRHGRFPVENLQFEDAGHHTGNVPLRPTGDSVRLGGTAPGIAHAQAKSWEAIIRFLSEAWTAAPAKPPRAAAPGSALETAPRSHSSH